MARTGSPNEWVALVGSPDHVDLAAEILESYEDAELVSFADTDALLGFSTSQDPELILVWVGSAATGPFAFVGRLMQRFDAAPVIILSPTIERRGVRAALTAGAAGLVSAQHLSTALDPSIRAVRAGQTCVPREHARQLANPVLSAREKQILGLVVMGYSNSQIAKKFFLAESTVKSHLSSAFAKLGVGSRNEAVQLILDGERGFGMGILAIGGEPIDSPVTSY
jgi:two-component system, NarL family, response regulator